MFANKFQEISKQELEKVKGGFIVIEDVRYSDKRLKNSMDEYTDGLDQAMKFRPVSYQYNSGALVAAA
ncbi:MAG: tail fiber domain-containing protein [Bacteroidota bacterium]